MSTAAHEGLERSASPAPRATAGWVAVAVATVVLAQVSRVLFPIMFEIGEDWDFIAAGLLALAVFAAPVLARLLATPSPSAGMATGAVLLGGALVALRLADPIAAWLAMSAVAVALVGATLLATHLPDVGTGGLPVAVITGLALDAALKGVFHSWDLAWQTSTASLLVTVVLVAALWVAVALVPRDAAAPRLAGAVPPAAWVALGGFAMVHLVFLHNAGFLASQAGVGYPWALAAILAGDAASVLVLAGAAGVVGRAVLLTGAVASVALGWALTAGAGSGVVFVVVALQVLLGIGLAAMVARPPATGRGIAAMAGGSVLFLALILVWQIYLDRELPLPREAVPAIAAAIAVWPSVIRGPSRLGTPVGPGLGVAGVLAAMAVVLPVGLWLTHPSEAERSVGDTVRLVNYNVRGAVDVDGQVRPDRVASEILTSDPDVVVLQEVGRGWPIHATTDLLWYLQRELEMQYVFERAGDQQFGNVIMSRVPMQELAAEQLPEDGTQERSYILVSIETGAGDLAVAATHLHSRSVIQISALLEAVGRFRPLVVAGDMNIAPDDPEVASFVDARLTDVVGATGDACRTTSMEPTSACDRPDWVFATDDLAIDRVRIGTGGASDHRALHVTVRIAG